MKRLLAVLGLALAACDGQSAGGTAAQIATSDAILERLKEPFEPAPGTRFAKEGGPSQVVGGYSGAQTREAYRTIGFALALEAVDIPKLAARAREVDSHYKGLAELKAWNELAYRLKKGRGALDELAHALGLYYADRFSGLGLSLDRHHLWLSDEADGCAINLKDGPGANVVRIETWVTVLEARAFVSLTYFAHSGDRSVTVHGKPPAWGTRR